MTMESLLGWWNVIYVAPFAVALLYLLLYAASGLTFGDADADADLSADADAHVDADVDTDADVGADADGDLHGHADAGADGGDDAHPSLQAAALSWIGLGRVPLSILLMVMLFAWGAAGFVVNQVVRTWVNEPWQVAIASLPVAVVTALLVTRVVVRSIDRWLPLNETTAARRHALLGATGVAIYDVNERFGLASVRDRTGDLYHVPCRLEPGRGEVVGKGGRVVLTGYSAASKSFFVVPADAVAPAGGEVVPSSGKGSVSA